MTRIASRGLSATAELFLIISMISMIRPNVSRENALKEYVGKKLNVPGHKLRVTLVSYSGDQ